MRHINTGARRGKFNLLTASRNAQAAMMTLRPGATSDDEPNSEHPDSEQWVYVVSGSRVARIGNARERLRRVQLVEHSLLLIERREIHQIENTGRKPLITLSLYVPPAYDPEGP